MPRYCLVVSDGLGFSIAVLSRVAGIGKKGENDWGVHSSPILLEVEFRILGSFLLVFSGSTILSTLLITVSLSCSIKHMGSEPNMFSLYPS